MPTRIGRPPIYGRRLGRLLCYFEQDTLVKLRLLHEVEHVNVADFIRQAVNERLKQQFSFPDLDAPQS